MEPNLLMDKESKVLELREKGYSYLKIARELNISRSTALYFYNRARNEKEILNRRNKIEEQKEFENIVCLNVSKVNSMYELCCILNKKPTLINYEYLQRIIDKHSLDVSHFSKAYDKKYKKKTMSFEEMFSFSKTSLVNGNRLKEYLIKNEIKEEKCECCGNVEWQGKKIPLQLHHINGDRRDNRIENLQILCPNCHAQTDNYSGKNIKKEKKKYICIYCNKEFYFGEGSSKTSKRYCSCECRDAYTNKKNKPYIKGNVNHKRPSREQLIEDFKEFGSFERLGKKYDVTGKSIKKWFKSSNLPSSSKELRSIIINKYGKQPQWNLGNKHNIKTNVTWRKRVYVYTKENEYITSFESAREAAEKLSLKSEKTIRAVCLKTKKSYCGYIFRYEKNELQLRE